MNIKRIAKEKISGFIYNYKKITTSDLFKKGRCRILLYHSVQEFNPEKDKMGLVIHPDIFHMQMQYLKQNKFYIMRLSELMDNLINNRNIPEKSIVITFDDGYKSILTRALPILRGLGFSASLFVNINFIERKIPVKYYWHNWDTLNWEEVEELHKARVAIGSHGLTHRKLTELNNQELNYEIMKSKELIESRIKDKINSFSYPHGAFNKKIKKILKDKSFLCSCSSIEGINDYRADFFSLRRTEITSFDNTKDKFEKKISGCHDWLRFFRFHD